MRNKSIYFILCLSFLIGCGTKRAGIVQPIGTTAKLLELPIQKRDTIPVRKQLTTAQIQQFLEASYKYNYDKLFAPQFSQLNGVIKSQAASIQRLTVMYGEMRNRAIHNRDSMQRVIQAYQEQVIKTAKAQIASNNAQTESNNKQIQAANRVIRILFFCGLILTLAVFGLYLFNTSLYRRIKQLQKSLNYD